jgi:hypothetical protein
MRRAATVVAMIHALPERIASIPIDSAPFASQPSDLDISVSEILALLSDTITGRRVIHKQS